MCGPDDRFFSGAQRCYAILEPSACDPFRACEQTVLRSMCSVYGCAVYTSPSVFWNSIQETEITTISQMMWVVMSSNSCAIAKSATAKLKMKMKMLPAGFSVGLCDTAVQSCDRQSNRSFLLLRIADFVVDAVDAVDVSVSEFVLSPPGEHLAFSGMVLMHRQILVAVEEVSGDHQHSNEEPNVWRSVTVQ